MARLMFLITACSCVIANVAHGAAYEPFDYPPGSDLRGLNGGQGFAGPWMAHPVTPMEPGASIGQGSLPDASRLLATTGNHLDLIDSLTQRPVAQSIGAAGTDLWVSFLMRRAGPNQSGAYMGAVVRSTNGGWYFVGEPGSGPHDNFYVIGRPGEDDTVASTGVPATQETAFLVLHVRFQSGNDVGTLYVNPTPGVHPTGGATFHDMDLIGPNLTLHLEGLGAARRSYSTSSTSCGSGPRTPKWHRRSRNPRRPSAWPSR